MTIRRLVLVVIGLILSTSASLGAQEAVGFISLGGVRLALGMEKTQVLESLGVAYELQFPEGAGADFWNVRRRDVSRTSIGSVQFVEDQLIVVNKTWEPYDQTSRGLFNAFFQALESITERGGRQCMVYPNTYETTSPPARIANISCGSHSVTLSESGVNEVLAR